MLSIPASTKGNACMPHIICPFEHASTKQAKCMCREGDPVCSITNMSQKESMKLQRKTPSGVFQQNPIVSWWEVMRR